jgi:hypothetical protein
MKKLIELYKQRLASSEKYVHKLKDGIAKNIINRDISVYKDLILAIEVISNEIKDLNTKIEILSDNQNIYYYKCDRCETLIESHDAYPPDQVCTSENKSRTSGICGGKFSIRLTREEYLDYFNTHKA